MEVYNDIKKILVSEEDIERRSKEIGKMISEDYKGKDLVLIALLKGSVPFMAELMKSITIDMETEYMQVSSYQGTKSTEVKVIKDVDRSLEGCDVIIVEDIVDTGKTISTVKKLIQSKGANSVKVASLLNKQGGRQVEMDVDYIGFEIPDEFVVGYGLDFNQKLRNIPFVGVLKEECYKE